MEWSSWGQYRPVKHAVELTGWRSDNPFSRVPADKTVLAYGQGRSYGDVCLNDDGYVVSTKHLNHLIKFDRENGVLRAEAGLTLAEILTIAVPHGWFLPVSPGTKFVSLGGAIANDIHGKNHHVAGAFGRHVRAFELLRSDGSRHLCSPQQNTELFSATIGGLGLTGLVTWAEIQLRQIYSSNIEMESLRFHSLEEFFAISKSSATFEYTVAWLDCISSGSQFGRGIFMRGNHAQSGPLRATTRHLSLSVPFHLPAFALNRFTVRCFNELYYRRLGSDRVAATTHFEPFFYPLDSILNWNRIYGPKGLLQFQCVVPQPTIAEILHLIVESGQASFLAVLKEFGEIASPGLLSFPRPGTTLALDFPHRGAVSCELFSRLEDVVVRAGGALYPAKDALMTADHYKAFYPNWSRLEGLRDPRCSSNFWRRVTEDGGQ